MMDGPVCFGNINPGHITSGLWESFTKLVAHDTDHQRYLGGFAVLKSSGLVSIYRNKVALAFHEDSECEWLWFVDSDIHLRDDTLDRLMEIADPEKVPILGALYFMGNDEGVVPCVMKRKKHLDGTVKIAPVFTADDYPRDALLRVDGLGMGCTLIHRSVLDEMMKVYGLPEPFFAQEYDEGGILCGEDVSFCMRADKLGFPSHVATGVEVGHEKTIVLTSEIVR